LLIISFVSQAKVRKILMQSPRKKSIHELHKLDPVQFKQIKKVPLDVVLDNVRSEHNVGAIFRTSDAFLIHKLHLCGITPYPPSAGIEKTALGATQSVDWEQHPSTVDVLMKLKTKNKIIVGIEQVQGNTYLLTPNFSFPSPELVLVLGNEMFGLSDDILPLCDFFLEIPQFGTKHSLNVSVAFGMVIFAYYHQFYRLFKNVD